MEPLHYSKAIGRLRDQKGATPLALVTGGSSGMGFVYAQQLAREGCDVLLVSNQADLLPSCVADITTNYGVQAHFYYCDLTAENAPEQILTFCREKSLQVDILINNAGMFFFKELNYQQDKARIRAILHLHILAATKLSLLFGEEMKSRGYGYILNVSSMTASLPVPGITLYSATKTYLKSFTCSYYFEMRPYGVGVTVVCPAAVATPLYKIGDKWMKLGLKMGVIDTPQWLVKKALNGLFKKKKIVRPGLLNWLLPGLIGLLPNSWVLAIWKKVK